MPTTPEAAVKSLSRLPANTTCPNCGTHSKYGFSTVCIKYLTFVCNSCKTSHQAISHRCKSLTMSSWDHGEVLQLKTHGNEYARKVWLGRAPPVGEGGRPKEGDDINLFKRFVVDAYENKKYYVEPEAVEGGIGQQQQQGVGGGRSTSRGGTGRTIKTHAPNVALQHNGLAMPSAPPQRMAPPPQPVKAAPVSAPAPEVDLLDFGAFDSAPLSSNAPPPNAQFVQPNSAPVAADPFDPFNTNATATATAPVASNPIQMGPTIQGNNAFGNPSFDPFGNAPTNNQAQTLTSNVPIMNNNFGIMGGMSSGMINGGMVDSMINGGMSNPMMMQIQMQQNIYGGMPANNMMNGMNNRMGNNMGMMGDNNMMTKNSMGMSNGGSAAPQPAMNMNIMQPMNNSISNNFGSKPADAGKKDPFAGLGF